jgi:serine/threonine-protein kinase RsbW
MDGVAASLRAELPFTFAAPALARERVRRFAADLPTATVDDAVLMVSELVTNAVQHGRPVVTLGMSLSPEVLTVAVGDWGRAPVTPRVPTANQERGRGLAMVDALAAHWGVTNHDSEDGRQVWFDVAAT